MDSLLQEIQGLKKKAVMYDNVKGRYVEAASKIQDAILILATVAKELNPTINPMSNRKKSEHDFKDVIEQCVAKMREGTQITTALLESTYGFNAGQNHYVMQKLKAIPKAVSRKEGIKVYVYFQKEG